MSSRSRSNPWFRLDPVPIAEPAELSEAVQWLWDEVYRVPTVEEWAFNFKWRPKPECELVDLTPQETQQRIQSMGDHDRRMRAQTGYSSPPVHDQSTSPDPDNAL